MPEHEPMEAEPTSETQTPVEANEVKEEILYYPDAASLLEAYDRGV